MIRWFTIATCIALSVLLAAAPAAADQVDADEPADSVEQLDDDASDGSRAFDTQHRIQIYEANRLNAWHAVGYTALFPGLGNFYAEQYALGTVALSAMVFAGMFAGFGLMHGHLDLLQIAAAIAGSAYVGGGITSFYGVRAHNRQLRRSLHIDDHEYDAQLTEPGSASVSLSFRF